MDDAVRVRSLEYDAAFDSCSNERDAGMIASSVSDTFYLHRNAAHQGFLSQANHVICKGVNYQQLTEFEAATFRACVLQSREQGTQVIGVARSVTVGG